MAKKEQIAVRLPLAALAMVDDLIGSTYGTSQGEVVRSIVLRHLERLAADKLVTWRIIKGGDEPENDCSAE